MKPTWKKILKKIHWRNFKEWIIQRVINGLEQENDRIQIKNWSSNLAQQVYFPFYNSMFGAASQKFTTVIGKVDILSIL